MIDCDFSGNGGASEVDDLEMGACAEIGCRGLDGDRAAVHQRHLPRGIELTDRDLIDCKAPPRQCNHGASCPAVTRDRALQSSRTTDRHRQVKLTGDLGYLT